jgi:ribosomal protein S5
MKSVEEKKENKNIDEEKHIKASKITEFEEKVIEIKRVSK